MRESILKLNIKSIHFGNLNLRKLPLMGGCVMKNLSFIKKKSLHEKYTTSQKLPVHHTS